MWLKPATGSLPDRQREFALYLVACVIVYLCGFSCAKGVCPGDCSGKGVCNELFGECVCLTGWGGPDCSRNLLPSCQLRASDLPFTGEGITIHSAQVTFPQDDTEVFGRSDLLDHAEQGHVRSLDLIAPISCKCARELAWFWRADTGRAWMCYDVDASLDELFDDPPKYMDRRRAMVMQEGYPVVDIPEAGLEAFKNVMVQLAPMAECDSGPDRCGGVGFCRRWNENDRGFCECPGGCNESIWLMHSCPVSCNFRGKCVKGLCLCEDGFWGNDCGVTWGTTANGDIAPVLDLDYKVGGAGIVFPAAAPADSPVTVGSQGDPPMYPDDATFYIVDQPPQFRSQPNVWEHGDFWPLVYGDPRRTADPRNADYFFFTQSMYMSVDAVLANFKWLQEYWLPYEMSGRAVHFGIGVLDHGATDYLIRWWSVPSPGVKDDFNLAYEDRKFFYLQYHMGKMADASSVCWSCVQEGKDIPIPIRARAINGPLEYDTIEFLRENSPWSTLRDTAPAESTPKSTGGAAVTGDSNSGQDSESEERPYLLFYAGAVPTWVRSRDEFETHKNEVLNDIIGRVSVFYYHMDKPDFRLVATYHDEGTKEKVIAAKEMLASKFCYAPYGGTTGYSGRYLNALLFGCVPVFWTDGASWGISPVLNEHPDVNWEDCSLTVTRETIPTMDVMLRQAVEDGSYERMRECIRDTRLWERMLFTEWDAVVKGLGKKLKTYIGESGHADAWHTVWEILALRLRKDSKGGFLPSRATRPWNDSWWEDRTVLGGWWGDEDAGPPPEETPGGKAGEGTPEVKNASDSDETGQGSSDGASGGPDVPAIAPSALDAEEGATHEIDGLGGDAGGGIRTGSGLGGSEGRDVSKLSWGGSGGMSTLVVVVAAFAGGLGIGLGAGVAGLVRRLAGRREENASIGRSRRRVGQRDVEAGSDEGAPILSPGDGRGEGVESEWAMSKAGGRGRPGKAVRSDRQGGSA